MLLSGTGFALCACMSVSILSLGLHGIDAEPIDVEVDFPGGLPGTTIVGLPQGAVREARDRVASALGAAGAAWPGVKVTINLAPADRRKDGSAYDLPMAVGVLAAAGLVPVPPRDVAFVGELSLDGRLRPVAGLLSMALRAKELGLAGLVTASAGVAEARLVEGVSIIGASSLAQVREFVAGGCRRAGSWATESESEVPVARPSRGFARTDPPDLSVVRGQASARRALEIAAAGGHNLLLSGPPGVGKTLLARCLSGILPRLTTAEAIDVTRIHSAARLGGSGLLRERPFRAPHHTISEQGMVGGGVPILPGEVSLAHRGVLFLDELTEFRRSVLELLRQPLEDRQVEIARARERLLFPAAFMLVAATNPCPCGYYGSPSARCTCTESRIRAYNSRISGPLLDRFDVSVELAELPLAQLSLAVEVGSREESSAVVRARVVAARELSAERNARLGCGPANSDLGPAQLAAGPGMEPAAREALRHALAAGLLSARGQGRVLRVARTIEDLAQNDGAIRAASVDEALSYRLRLEGARGTLSRT